MKENLDQFIWAVLSFFIGLFLDRIISFFSKKYKERRTKNRICKFDALNIDEINILSLDHADPQYNLVDLQIKKTNKQLYIRIPEDYVVRAQRIDEEFKTHDDLSLNGKKDFQDLVSETKIPNLVELIEKHRKIVAEDFINKLSNQHSIFNGEKYGIYNLRITKSNDREERSRLNIEVFETDYFTHCVFRSIYKQLVQENNAIAMAGKENLMQYRAFLTSFGINTFVITNTSTGETGESIIFATRSSRVANSNGKPIIHLTMNEGLSQTDFDSSEVSITQCLYRGLREELGIKERERDYITNNSFTDLFLEKNNFEIGIVSQVKMDISFEDLKAMYNIAKDSQLETDSLIEVKLKESEINKFLNSNKNNISNACRYALNMILYRM